MFDTVKEWLSSPDLAKDVTLQLMAAQIYLANGRLKEGQTKHAALAAQADRLGQQ